VVKVWCGLVRSGLQQLQFALYAVRNALFPLFSTREDNLTDCPL
jgi:hypothetical protein